MQQLSDKEIWNKLRAGDKTALKLIYDDHINYLVNYGKKIFRDIHKVEDAIHDLFVDIWNRKENLGETDSVRKYLAACLRRRIIADLKKHNKAHSVESFDTLDFNLDLSIEEILINKEDSEDKIMRLKCAMESLSSRQKEVIYLKFYKGLDYDQISEIVGIRYQSLRNLISAAVKKLRTEMVCLLLVLLFTY